MLSTEEINLIADAVAARIHAPAIPRDVLTAKEAMAFVGKDKGDARQAFARWKKKNNVRPCAKGRYSLRALKAGLEREARKSL